MTVGSVGTGTLLAAGGSNTLSGDVYVGYSTNSVGSVVLAAGQLVTSNGNVAVGFYGSGQITVSNGMLMSITNAIIPPTGILLGVTASANGTLTVLGGTCFENGHLDLGEELGSTGLV
jgi:T5SS/PEP-CTERM-associated repeat protein